MEPPTPEKTRAHELRKERKLTILQAAHLAGVAEKTLRRVEQGHDAKYSTLARMAHLYGVNPGELREPAGRPTVDGVKAAPPSKGA